MSARPFAWILVTVRGRPALTGRCLEALMRLPPEEYRLIVVDNGSRDETLDELYRMFRLGKIYRLICNQVGTMPQWEKCYAIRQAVRIAMDDPGEMFAWIDNDVVVKDGWLDAARSVLAALPEVEVCSLHNDNIQERRHKTLREVQVGQIHVRLKLTANGAAWVMRGDFFAKHGLPPIGLGVNREGTEDWFYSDKLRADGRPRFAVIDYANHIGYQNSLKHQVIAAIKKQDVGVDE